MKLHRYRATIRGSNLPLFQVFFFTVTLLLFDASRQPKYVSFYLLSCQLLVFSLSRKVSFSYLGFIAVKSLSRDLRLIVKLLSPIVI